MIQLVFLIIRMILLPLSEKRKAVNQLLISVIGDIRSGKIQPSLTGNEIVDNALIQNFCDQLQKELTEVNPNLVVEAEHFFNVDDATSDVYILDQKVLNSLGNDLVKDLNIIVINHSDLVWGITTTAKEILLNHQFTPLTQ